MKIKILFIIFFSSFALLLVPHALAKSIAVQGRIDNPGAGGRVIFKDTFTQKVIATTSVNPMGAYSLTVPDGLYDITFIPLAGTGIPPITKYHQQIGTSTVHNFSVPASKANYLMRHPSGIPLSYIVITLLMMVVGGIVAGYFIWKKKNKSL